MVNIENILVNGPVSTKIIDAENVKYEKMTDSGAHAVFLGQVRADVIDGKTVDRIEYSAYPEMVKYEAEKIQKIIKSKYNQVTNISVKHSIGGVKAGELSLYVRITSKHRKQAFDACIEIVELIKDNFPVWKKEILEDGSYIWTENKK